MTLMHEPDGLIKATRALIGLPDLLIHLPDCMMELPGLLTATMMSMFLLTVDR
jgi:hypothetical protein